MTLTARQHPSDDPLEAVLDRAQREPDFRHALLGSDAEQALAAAGVQLRQGVTLRVVAEEANEVVLVLPSAAAPENPLPPPAVQPVPYAGTNISANSGCHQCCKPH